MLKVGIFALGIVIGGTAWAEENPTGQATPLVPSVGGTGAVETPAQSLTASPERLGQSVYRKPLVDERALDGPASIPGRGHNCGRTSSPSA